MLKRNLLQLVTVYFICQLQLLIVNLAMAKTTYLVQHSTLD